MSRLRGLLPWLALLTLAGVLRFARLDAVPLGFYWDEAAICVNARSLVATGRDQYGELLPFYCRALDDYKDPLFVYGVAAWSLVAGDDVAGARSFAALLGLLSLVGAGLLGREVLGPGRGPLLAAGLLALGPWHLQYSRMAWQAISLVCVQTFALWLLLRAARLAGRPGGAQALAGGAALLGLTLWTYSPAKLWVPLLGGLYVGLVATRPRPAGAPRWPFAPRATALAALVGAAVALPFALAYARHQRGIDLRLQELTLLGRPGAAGAVLEAYLAHWDPRFLFLSGDPIERHSPPGVGMLLVAEAPLLVAGLVALARDRRLPARLLLAWLLLAPLLGALTRGAPHASRTIALLPALQLTAAAGALWLVRRASPARRRLLVVALALGVGAAAVHAARATLVLAPRRTGWAWWRPGLPEVVERARSVAAREGLGPIHFLPGTLVTYVDWIYLVRVPPATLHAQRARTGQGRDVYDPFDRAEKFQLEGARFPGRTVGPGALVVQGPLDEAPEGLLLVEEVGAFRYWRVP